MSSNREIKKKKEAARNYLINSGASSLNSDLKIVKRRKVKTKVKPKSKTKRKSTKKKNLILLKWFENENLPNVLRMAFLMLILGFVLFGYYLLTENKLLSIYEKVLVSVKSIVLPLVVFICYTFFVYRLGYRTSKKKK